MNHSNSLPTKHQSFGSQDGKRLNIKGDQSQVNQSQVSNQWQVIKGKQSKVHKFRRACQFPIMAVHRSYLQNDQDYENTRLCQRKTHSMGSFMIIYQNAFLLNIYKIRDHRLDNYFCIYATHERKYYYQNAFTLVSICLIEFMEIIRRNPFVTRE